MSIGSLLFKGPIGYYALEEGGGGLEGEWFKKSVAFQN